MNPSHTEKYLSRQFLLLQNPLVSSILRKPSFCFFCILIISLNSLLLFGETKDMDLPGIAQKVRPAVLQLTINDSEGQEVAFGTGFLVSVDGMLITNNHVIEDGKQVVAKTETGAYYIVEGMLADDPINDLVILKLQGKDFPYLVLGESKDIEVGTRVAVIGSPLGLEGSLSEGIVSAVRDNVEGARLLQITAAISPGSSGSPVLDSDGRVIGIANSTLTEGQALNFAIPIEEGMKLLTEAQTVKDPFPINRSMIDEDQLYLNDPDHEIFEDAKDPVEKLKLAQVLTKRYPQSARAHLDLGWIYLDLNFISDAIDAFQNSIQIDPEYHLTWLFLCDSYRKSDRKTEAFDACQHAVKLKPDESFTWYFLGEAYKESKKYEDAAASFQKAVRLDPGSANSWISLGRVSGWLSRYSDEMVACQKAIELASNNHEAWICIGWAYGHSGQYKAAIAAFEQAVELAPKSADAWSGLALNLESAGKHSEAINAAKTVIELEPKRGRSLFEMLILTNIR